MTISLTHPLSRTIAAIGIVGALALAGCTATASAPSGAASGQPSGQSSRSARPSVPGATGLIAEIDGTTMQVQGNNKQTAVSWTSATTFTQQVAGTLADITVGSCVRAQAADGTAATSVSVTAAVNGQCVMPGRGGGQGGQGGQRPSGRPSGAGSARPSGAPSGTPQVFGLVKDVSATSMTVSSAQPDGTTKDQTVALASSTTVHTSKAATSSALKVGLCATARGTADSTGAIAATSIGISDPVNGQCGFGR